MKCTTVLLFLSAILVLSIPVLSSCTTTDHAVQLAPLPPTVPVSASSMYSTGQGLVVSGEGYEVLNHFRFEKTLTGPVGVAGFTSKLDIGPDLLALAERNKADAVVNLRIIPETYDAGNTATVGALKLVGGMCLTFAALFEIMDIAMYDPNYPDHTMQGLAIGFGAVGGGSLIGYFVMQPNGKTVWTIAIEGDLVKQR
jgi:hypothetical protein